MASFFIFSAFIAVAAIAAFLFINGNKNIDRGVCSVSQKPPNNVELRQSLGVNVNYDAPLECYFSDNYYAARQQFLDLAKAVNAEMVSMKVVNDLTTDVAIFRGNPEKFLVHISGTHGVEAYSGSAAQAAILEYIEDKQLYTNEEVGELPTIVLIHALNPFGFANNRRVNEDNVDLNRNILSEEEFRFVKGRDPNYAGYVDLDSSLNPTSKFHSNVVINEILSFLVLGKSLMKYGLKALKKALVSGNYYKQKGVGFGGFEQTQSVKNLLNLLVNEIQLPSLAKEFILLDVHTGLGPEGVDTLMFHGSEEWSKQMESIFPTDYLNEKTLGGIKVEEFSASPLPDKQGEKISDSVKVDNNAKEVASGYELTVGTVSGSLCSNYLSPNKNIKFMCITQVCFAYFIILLLYC